ncbi:MAG: ribonuclease Z [Candidatus Thorarchaeota archaeon]|nr:MAG: ribonuclease Z [Candidatus Thorarchaeota archaeon]
MFMIEIVFLGSGGSIPTATRNHPAIAIRYEGWVLLLDAGEDVQRQYAKAQLGLNKKMAIFVSHVHADHVLGLPGLLLRFSLLGRIKPLNIYGPKDLIEYVKVSQSTINLGTTFEAVVHAIEPGIIFQEQNLKVRAFKVDHRGYALGYEITWTRPTGKFIPTKAEGLGIPKGPLWKALASGKSVQLDDGTKVTPEEVTEPSPKPLKIVYSGDTRPCDELSTAANGADILINEAMYTTEHEDLAEERGHSTAAGAAKLARDADVQLLILTHYSPRYYEGNEIIEEAMSIFPNTVLARDHMRIQLASDGSCIVVKPPEN